MKIAVLAGAILLVGSCAVFCADTAGSLKLRVDFARTNGTLRALHGINRGPLVAGGLIDLTEAQRELNIPFTRLHDSHWPATDVVDVHAVFPDFARDAGRPESYDFRRTDEYVAAVRATGAEVVYRLGESIEHEAIKKHVHPPADPAQWAQICLGIIRHYNEGWANGARYGIRYWEIWNEPENRPACWTGNDEQFLALYAVAARQIKAQFPNLKVGGPGFGYTGEIRGGIFRAGGLLTNFLAFCRRGSVPLDFLSWHCYTDDPRELLLRAGGLRVLLDAEGFTNAESHLNEWNYLPGKDWSALSRTRGTPESRRKFYREMCGEAGAAFITAALIDLQQAPVNMANLFHGETGPFGLFDIHGGAEKNYFALRLFAELLKTPHRVWSEQGQGIHVAAALNDNGSEAHILVSSLPVNMEASSPHSSPSSNGGESIRRLAESVPPVQDSKAGAAGSGGLSGAHVAVRMHCENLHGWQDWRGTVQVVDATHDLELDADARFEEGVVTFTLRRPGVALVSLRRKE